MSTNDDNKRHAQCDCFDVEPDDDEGIRYWYIGDGDQDKNPREAMAPAINMLKEAIARLERYVPSVGLAKFVDDHVGEALRDYLDGAALFEGDFPGEFVLWIGGEGKDEVCRKFKIEDAFKWGITWTPEQREAWAKELEDVAAQMRTGGVDEGGDDA